MAVFDLFNDQLVFGSETTAFDATFDPTLGYEVPAAITSIEWLDEQKVLVANDKEIKVFQVTKSVKKNDSSAVETLKKTGELRLPIKVETSSETCLT